MSGPGCPWCFGKAMYCSMECKRRAEAATHAPTETPEEAARAAQSMAQGGVVKALNGLADVARWADIGPDARALRDAAERLTERLRVAVRDGR